MNPIELLNKDSVILLEDGDGTQSCIFRLDGTRQVLFKSPRELLNQWFGEGVPCEVLVPNRLWRKGHVKFYLYFEMEQPDQNAQASQEDSTKSFSSPLNRSPGLMEIPASTTVLSLHNSYDALEYLGMTFTVSQVEGRFLSLAYDLINGKSPKGERFFGEVHCSLLAPYGPWCKGTARVQIGFIESLLESEAIVEITETKNTPGEIALDDSLAPFSPLDEIRKSHLS